MKAVSVIYDQQLNQYYTVDKNTGEMNFSEKNGQPKKRFNFQYTGKDFHLRKEKEKSLSPSYMMKKPFKVKYFSKNGQPQKKELSKSLLRIKKTTSKNCQGEKGLKRYATATSLYQSKISHIKPSQFCDKLMDYSEIKENKINENHSPLKNIQGSKPMKKLMKQYDNKIINGLDQKESRKSHRNFNSLNRLKLLEGFQSKKQILKEKQIFLKYHPELMPKENIKQLKQLKDRKINLKILQKLSLQQNDRCTKNIYQ